MFRKDLALVGVIIAILALMVVPLNSTLIDILIALNITLSVLLLMVAIYLKHPSDFSTFPSVILIGTAFRLALSIGTTRLILSEADGGAIIETFGDFVVRGTVAIGLVIFLIITVVQFLVVTKGAERVAEVGARFALDALPGKQMSIDADLRAGNIEQEEATARRERLNKDSQFFGAMDGAMKFVKGDAIAGLIIIMINLIGGVAVGVSVHGLSFGGAVEVYSLLTIGDGLVAQIPALIMSLCAGVVVTRATNADNKDLGTDIFKELITDARVPTMAAIVIFGMGFIPGFPFWVFFGASVALMIAAIGLRRAYAGQAATEDAEQTEAEEGDASETSPEEEATETVSDRFVCHIAPDLAEQLDLPRVKAEIGTMFASLFASRGTRFPVPGIVVSKTLEPGAISIDLDEVPIHRRVIPEGMQLIGEGEDVRKILGPDETLLIDAEWLDQKYFWAPPEVAQTARSLSLTVYDLDYKIAELVFRIYEQNLAVLFSKIEFDALMEEAKQIDSDAIGELERALTRPALFQVMRNLIEDGVPLKPMRLVVEALTYWQQASDGAGPAVLSECLRGSLKRQMCHVIAGPANILGLAMVDPEIEEAARMGLNDAKRTGTLSALEGLVFEADISDQLVGAFQKLQAAPRSEDAQIAVVVSSDLRRRLRNFLAAHRIHLPVLAPHEISSDVKAYPVEMISVEGISGRSDGFDEDVFGPEDYLDHDYDGGGTENYEIVA